MPDDRPPEEKDVNPEEETAYHFSEDDVSYEVSEEQAKPKESPLKVLGRRLMQSRMLISFIVFVVLVLIVYKIVAPSAPTINQPGEMTPLPANTLTATAPQVTPAQSLPPQNAPTAPVTNPTSSATSPTVSTTPAATPQTTMAPTQPAVVAQPPAAPTTEPYVRATPQAQPPMAPLAPATPTYPTPTATAQPPQVSTPAAVPYATSASATATPASIQSPNIPSTTFDAEIERLSNRLHQDYQVELNRFAEQNKGLQDQVQALNNKMASIEGQLNQLTQFILKQNQASHAQAAQQQQPAKSANQHLGYTVQAIIPGRAWLKSDNGETITVAEGDTLPNAGRVTKIDPYDGVVQINTGDRVVSLTYGSSD